MAGRAHARGVAAAGSSFALAQGSSAPDELDRSSKEPLNEQLASLMRTKIYRGEWPSRSVIPSEHELMARYGVSRGTVRHAIKNLVDEGLLDQRMGRGTFVTPQEILHPAGIRPISFAESLHAQGLDFRTEVLAKERMGAPSDVASELEIEPGDPVLFLRRVRRVDGMPIICQESWEALEKCPGFDQVDFTKESAFDAVERCSHHHIKSSMIRYTARLAGKEHGGYLCCDAYTAVLVLEQNIRFDNGEAFEWSLTWLKPGQAIVGTAVNGY